MTGEKTEDTNARPPMWVGHISMKVPDVAASKTFLMAMGMRDVEPFEHMAILEMRAGTHLIIQAAEDPVEPGTEAPFDLMVDDIDAYRAQLEVAGLNPTEMESNPVHKYFFVREPGGHDVLVNSSHNTGLPV